MKQLTCEMCGSTDLIKQDGVFVCQTCGCKYSIEEAKKMMVEGTVEVVGTVKVDNTAAIENYLDMARNALDASNYSEADNYCNRIIEMDIANWEAWFIKGKAVGWQSTLGNIRITETINAFSKAIENCPEEKKEKLGEDCKKELENLQAALLSARIRNFKTHPSEHDISSLRSDVQTILTTSVNFLIKAQIMIDPLGNIQYARIINNGICDAWQNVYKDYIGDENHPSDFDLTRLISEGDILINALELALALCGDKDDNKDLNDLKIQIYKNLIHMQKEIKDGQSYEISFDGGWKHYKKSKCLTEQAKIIRQDKISEWQAKISQIKSIGAQKAAEAAQKRREKYWAEHGEERKQLEEEQKDLYLKKDSLSSQIDDLLMQANSVPYLIEQQKKEAEISALAAKKESLGLFKGKEKQVIQDQISILKEEFATLTDRANKERAPICRKIEELQTDCQRISQRIQEIQDEFDKDR